VEPDELRRYHEAVATFRALSSIPSRPGEAGAEPPEPGAAAPAPGADLLVPDALGFLLGRWRLHRRLVDHAARCSGTFSGMAQFAPSGSPLDAGRVGVPELTYREEGELRFGGHRGPASRSLVYRGRPDGTADVFFADGRDFYHLDPRSGAWRAEHPCAADHYAMAGRVLRSGELEERWRVRGPDKDYEIRTTLVRG
jgi:hypothetical protein